MSRRCDKGEADATCDGRRQNDWVELERVEREKGKRLGFAENGDAWLDVPLTESGRKGDSVEDSFEVRVVAAPRLRRPGCQRPGCRRS